jgi:pyruvate/2-oxoglutarate dehydrogenase complex dihydrolipoamide acyltransferase (E2) component
MPLIALAAFLPAVSAFAQDETQTAPAKPGKTPTQLPAPKAEPENPQAYAAPAPHEKEGPSAADVGPAQQHFVRASTTDDLAVTQNADNNSLKIHEKIALDKRISVPKIHDVQNDGPNGGGDNHALKYEVTYLNWGAVTDEQLMARRGHYFTITWDNDGPKADFTARFEYREVKSKEIVRTLTQKMPAVSGSTRSYFAVVDKAYLAYGPVVSWRFTVLKGDTVVAEAKSFIW